VPTRLNNGPEPGEFDANDFSTVSRAAAHRRPTFYDSIKTLAKRPTTSFDARRRSTSSFLALEFRTRGGAPKANITNPYSWRRICAGPAIHPTRWRAVVLPVCNAPPDRPHPPARAGPIGSASKFPPHVGIGWRGASLC